MTSSDTHTATGATGDVAAVARRRESRQRIAEQLGRVIVGQHDVIEQLLVTLFCRGHAMVVGLPKILIDPFQDKRHAYHFYVNPLGARSEGLAYGGDSSLNWDGIWEAKSRVLENGWSAELRIPFKTISFKPGLSEWGINVERIIPRKLETIRLSGTNRDSNFNNPMDAAALTGIAGVRQGKGITFKPYGLAVPQPGARLRPRAGTIRSTAGLTSIKTSLRTSSASSATTWISPRPRSTSTCGQGQHREQEHQRAHHV